METRREMTEKAVPSRGVLLLGAVTRTGLEQTVRRCGVCRDAPSLRMVRVVVVLFVVLVAVDDVIGIVLLLVADRCCFALNNEGLGWDLRAAIVFEAPFEM
jgi:hypothetical protein